MEPNPDRPAFPHPILVPPGEYEAVRVRSPFRCGGEDWYLVKVGDRLAGMSVTGWLKKAGRPRQDPEPAGEWSF